MASSFVSEHSVEFVLVPQFAEILSVGYETVVPIYFWHSREGGNISKDCFRNRAVRIVVLYPRRPKVANAYQLEIEVKFNEVLFEQSRQLKEKGIPVFAGVPLASSLDNFTVTTNCAWFKINPSGYEEIIQLPCDVPTQILSQNIRQVSEVEILSIINEDSSQLSWPKAIEFLRELRNRSSYVRFWSFMGDTYKPTYFLLPV